MHKGEEYYYSFSYNVDFCYIIPQGHKLIKPVSGNIKQKNHITEENRAYSCTYDVITIHLLVRYVHQMLPPHHRELNIPRVFELWLFLMVMFLPFHKFNITNLSEQDWFYCPIPKSLTAVQHSPHPAFRSLYLVLMVPAFSKVIYLQWLTI